MEQGLYVRIWKFNLVTEFDKYSPKGTVLLSHVFIQLPMKLGWRQTKKYIRSKWLPKMT